MKLGEWAAREGVHYQTAWRWWLDGKLPVPAQQTVTGTILVEVPAVGGVTGGVVVYARVSSHDVLTSMCARLYGRRGTRNRAMRAVTAAKNSDVNVAA